MISCGVAERSDSLSALNRFDEDVSEFGAARLVAIFRAVLPLSVQASYDTSPWNDVTMGRNVGLAGYGDCSLSPVSGIYSRCLDCIKGLGPFFDLSL